MMSSEELKTYGDSLIDVNDFVMAHRDRFPELDNFLGFGEFENGNNEDVNINGAENSLN
jgi:hypothetical protein